MDATGARDLGAVVLGLEGFVLLAVDEHDRELELAVQTSTDMVGCPGCGAVAAAHGRRPVRVRDLPVGGRPTTLIWIKRLWRCRHDRCETRTWSETSPQIPARASLTTRAAQVACRRVGRDGESVAVVAWDLGVGWGTVMRAVVEHGAPRVDDPARLAGVRALGVDETAFLAANATHPTEFATGLVDLTRTAGPARLLDIVPGRSGAVLSSWLHGRDESWRAGVRVAALDPFRGYATALRTHLPRAVRVLDAFHVVKLGFDAVDQVRRRVQQDTLGHRGRAGDPLYGIRRVLRRGHDHHSDISWTRLLHGLDLGDPDGHVAAARTCGCSTATPIPTPRRRSAGSSSARTRPRAAWPAPWTPGASSSPAPRRGLADQEDRIELHQLPAATSAALRNHMGSMLPGF